MKFCRLIILLAIAVAVSANAQTDFSLAWWNVENFFDPHDNPATADDDFTPQGEYRWTYRKMCAKRDSVYKVVAAMGCPDIVALAEVENDTVMQERYLGTPLRKAGYKYVITSTPDNRGIGSAVMYRSSFTVDTAYDIPVVGSRSIFVVAGHIADGRHLIVLANHWASRRNGGGERRIEAAKTLRKTMSDLRHELPSACIVAMGDMNCTDDESPIAVAMGFGDSCRNADGAELLTCRLSAGEFSYYYQELWQNIDHTVLMLPENGHFDVDSYHVFAPDFMFVEHRTRLGRQPYRTHNGRRYQGGFSDHLPLLLKLKNEK